MPALPDKPARKPLTWWLPYGGKRPIWSLFIAGVIIWNVYDLVKVLKTQPVSWPDVIIKVIVLVAVWLTLVLTGQ